MFKLLIQEFKDLGKEFENTRKEFAVKIQGEFEKTVREISKNIPKSMSFSWTQFTPNFNDGDPCYFSVNASELTIGVEGIYHCEVYELKGKSDLLESIGITFKQLEKLHDSLSKLIYSIPKDIIKEIYGDDAIVTIENGKVEADEHDHY